LDAAIRRDLRRWLRGVHEATGSTTIFVTHDQEEAFELADRVVVMGAGRVEQIGHADAIHDHPATPFVARFMGATVELPVFLSAGRAEGSGLDLSNLSRRALPDGPARVFIRSEDITPILDKAAPWRIVNRMSNGAHLRLVLRHPDLGEAEADVPRRAVDAAALIPDTTVRLKIEAGTLFASDRQSTPAPETPTQKTARLESAR
jgi:sulfate transport system ATP-binding protein